MGRSVIGRRVGSRDAQILVDTFWLDGQSVVEPGVDRKSGESREVSIARC